MNAHRFYYIGSEDGRSIDFQKKEEVFHGPDITIKFWHIGMVIIIFGMVIGGGNYINTAYLSGADNIEIMNTSDIVEDEEPFDENGFVFADSSNRILGETEVFALLNNETIGFQRLLRHCINEIYARHGQVFETGGVNDEYYKRFSWYNEIDKHIVKWEEFNETEKTNLRLLISIEEEYGYR